LKGYDDDGNGDEIVGFAAKRATTSYWCLGGSTIFLIVHVCFPRQREVASHLLKAMSTPIHQVQKQRLVALWVPSGASKQIVRGVLGM
jgi:hypothetical protein